MHVIDTIEGEPFIPITLFHDSQQRMWAGTPGYGLVVFTGNNYIPDLLYDKNNEELNIVRAFAEDKTGTIWIATDGGAIFYRNNESDTYDTTSGLYSNEVSYIFQDSWEDIWFATINDELLTRNDGTYLYV
jgi:ligand-binding sensor domain-containing protein